MTSDTAATPISVLPQWPPHEVSHPQRACLRLLSSRHGEDTACTRTRPYSAAALAGLPEAPVALPPPGEALVAPPPQSEAAASLLTRVGTPPAAASAEAHTAHAASAGMAEAPKGEARLRPFALTCSNIHCSHCVLPETVAGQKRRRASGVQAPSVVTTAGEQRSSEPPASDCSRHASVRKHCLLPHPAPFYPCLRRWA